MWRVRFVRVYVCLAHREGYLRDRKKKKQNSDDFLCLHFSSLFFFSLSFNRGVQQDNTYPRRVISRVARPRPDLCGVA